MNASKTMHYVFFNQGLNRGFRTCKLRLDCPIFCLVPPNGNLKGENCETQFCRSRNDKHTRFFLKTFSIPFAMVTTNSFVCRKSFDYSGPENIPRFAKITDRSSQNIHVV